MAYRDDLTAAQNRIESLEGELLEAREREQALARELAAARADAAPAAPPVPPHVGHPNLLQVNLLAGPELPEPGRTAWARQNPTSFVVLLCFGLFLVPILVKAVVASVGEEVAAYAAFAFCGFLNAGAGLHIVLSPQSWHSPSKGLSKSSDGIPFIVFGLLFYLGAIAGLFFA